MALQAELAAPVSQGDPPQQHLSLVLSVLHHVLLRAVQLSRADTDTDTDKRVSHSHAQRCSYNIRVPDYVSVMVKYNTNVTIILSCMGTGCMFETRQFMCVPWRELTMSYISAGGGVAPSEAELGRSTNP
jgi:hypothetical protein